MRARDVVLGLSVGLLGACAPVPGRDAPPSDGDAGEATRDAGPAPAARRDAGRTERPPPVAGEAAECDRLVAVIRDFRGYDRGGHPDFENVTADEPDYDFASGRPEWPHVSAPYLAPELGADGTPQYVASGASPAGTIRGPDSFHDWYHDGPRSVRVEVPLDDMDPSDTRFVYDDPEFFPLDGMDLGDERSLPDAPGVRHNYHFTTAIVAEFQYRGGETFTFSGDDDVWVFVNGRLALDLGGHP